MDHAEIAYIVNQVLTKPSEETKELLERFEKTIRSREEALEEKDEPDEQFLTMECFEEIGYHFMQTSKISISFTKGTNIKDI